MNSATIVLGDGPLGPGATVDRDVMVRMRDGIHIACDVYRPKAPGKYPVLFASSPYIKDAVDLPSSGMYRYRETGNIAKWVDKGYVYVHADVRGSGKSEGSYDAFGPKEQMDYVDMIGWCGTQRWSTGKVGMIGESYYGMNQWQAAQHNPPHLACIAPYDAGADIYRHFVFKGGILANGFMNHWYNNSVRFRHFLDYPERPQRDDYFSADFLRELALHPNFDAYWQVRRADLKAIKCPAFTIGNWEGLSVHLLGNLQGFTMPSGPTKLLVTSGDAQRLYLSPEIEAQLERWYDHWLKGIDNGVMSEPRVRIFVRNGEGWRDEQEWPLKRAENRVLYLGRGPSGAVESLNDGALSWEKPAAADASTSYVSPDPLWTIPGIGTNVMGKMGLPHTTRRIVTFTSAPLESDMEVTGPVVLKLWSSSTATDMHVMASVMDMPPLSADAAAALKTVDAAPPARKVTMGWLKASHRALDPARSLPNAPYHSHENPQPLEPGKVYELDVEIWPTCWVFKAGHRIRLDIVSFDLGHWLGHIRGTDTFYHDARHPSHLVLPLIPR